MKNQKNESKTKLEFVIDEDEFDENDEDEEQSTNSIVTETITETIFSASGSSSQVSVVKGSVQHDEESSEKEIG